MLYRILQRYSTTTSYFVFCMHNSHYTFHTILNLKFVTVTRFMISNISLRFCFVGSPYSEKLFLHTIDPGLRQKLLVCNGTGTRDFIKKLWRHKASYEITSVRYSYNGNVNKGSSVWPQSSCPLYIIQKIQAVNQSENKMYFKKYFYC